SNNVPYCLAGSIRDDGPLPETVNDMIEAQKQYSEIVSGASMVIMLSSMLHSIGTGNMLPSWVKTVCVDINPAVVTKLADRGSSQAIGVVSDVGFFLRALATRLKTVRGS
ncbi:ornithine cyclodeaminase family domain, partial [Salinispira pacifica]